MSKFEIETLNDASGYGRKIYQSLHHYDKFIAENKRIRNLQIKMVDAFKNRKQVSEQNMIKIIQLLAE